MNSTMRSIYLLSCVTVFAAGLVAQVTVSIGGPASVRPGQQIPITVSIAGDAPAGVQWSVTLPAGWSGPVVAGSAAAAAAKRVYCNPAGLVCMVLGSNANAIGAGEIAKYAIAVPAAAAPGPASIALFGLLAATADGTVIGTTNGGLYNITVLAKSDLNGDGKTDQIDVLLMVAEIVGGGPCVDDQNGDGRCDLLDALLVVRAALGVTQ